jgi:hypothetical protein
MLQSSQQVLKLQNRTQYVFENAENTYTKEYTEINKI